MSFTTRLFLRFYQLLTCLYPASFRAQFEQEILQVVTDLIDEAGRKGKRTFLSTCWRELRDWPYNLIYQYWIAWFREEAQMSPMTELAQSTAGEVGISVDRPEPGSWKEAFLAGLPHLLFALLLGGGNLVYYISPDRNEALIQGVRIGLGLGFFTLVVGLIYYAYRHGWPLWSASWYPYGAWLVIILLELFNMALGLTENWQFNMVFILAGIGSLLVGYAWLFRHDQIKGLLTCFFLMPILMMLTLEFIPDDIELWTYVGIGLFVAVVAVTIIRINHPPAAFRLALGTGLLTSLVLAYVSVYLVELPDGVSHIPTLSEFAFNLAFYSLASITLIGGPKIFWSGWGFLRRKVFV
jgi:hypothetical protein